MSPIGGFFDLEIPDGTADPHPGALPLATGRACLLHFLRTNRPSHVWVPFFACEAVLAPFELDGVPVRFYAIDERLAPVSLPERLEPGGWILATQFFGFSETAVQKVVDRYPGRVLVDDTHAFFRGRRADAPSFTVARKYVGVPDGAYLHGVSGGSDLPRFVPTHLEHLLRRSTTRAEQAYADYRAAEDSLGVRALRMSSLSERLLATFDYASIRTRRRSNLAWVAERLGPSNQLEAARTVPDDAFTYPYLPPRPIALPDLHQRGFYIPRYWPGVIEREGTGFAWERRLARETIHVPIDHRYRPEGLQPLIEYLLAVGGS